MTVLPQKKRTSLNVVDQHYRFELSAEFNQFYLRDALAEAEVDWILEEGQNNLALAAGVISVGTNCDRIVPVDVHILDSAPPLNLELWDHLIECSIDVASGCLTVGGCFDLDMAKRIELEPGRYVARICYGNQYSDDHVDCADYYVIYLWRSNNEVFQVLKRRVDVFCELIA